MGEKQRKPNWTHKIKEGLVVIGSNVDLGVDHLTEGLTELDEFFPVVDAWRRDTSTSTPIGRGMQRSVAKP